MNQIFIRLKLSHTFVQNTYTNKIKHVTVVQNTNWFDCRKLVNWLHSCMVILCKHFNVYLCMFVLGRWRGYNSALRRRRVWLWRCQCTRRWLHVIVASYFILFCSNKRNVILWIVYWKIKHWEQEDVWKFKWVLFHTVHIFLY